MKIQVIMLKFKLYKSSIIQDQTWYAYLRVFSILWAIRAYWETRDKHSETISIILVACPRDSFLASSCSKGHLRSKAHGSRSNSGIFGTFELSAWNIYLNSSGCRASKIVKNDTKFEPISWKFNSEIPILNFCVGV